MISNKKYNAEIQELENTHNKKYHIFDNNYKHSPTYLIQGSRIDYASYITCDRHSPFGVLHILTESEIQLQNVYQYFIFIIDSNDKITPLFSQSDMLELADLKDFFLVCTHPTVVLQQEMSVDRIISCDLKIYRRATLLHTICNVQRIDKVGTDLRIIYTSQEAENVYSHWLYKNGKSELLIKDALSWTSETQNRLLLPNTQPNVYRNSDVLEIFFHKSNCKPCLILEEFAKKWDSFQIIPNIFSDDTSINYKVSVSQNRLDDIVFIQYCLMKNPKIGNFAIYGIPLFELKKGCYIEPSPQKVIAEFNKLDLSMQDEELYKSIISMLFSKYGEQVSTWFPKKFIYSEKTQDIQLCALTDFLRNEHPAYIESIHGNKEPLAQLMIKMQLLYNSTFTSLITSGLILPKWKSEYSLYEMVKKKYPCAIYQYRAKWLEFQSLDIFIPELSVAIEYQGIQHYKPIDIFGGKEHFEKQQKLDLKKQLLCKKNNIHLIEWRYDEPISILVLKNKLSKYEGV